MNKTELVKAIAKESNISRTAGLRVINVLLETIDGATLAKGTVSVVGYGSFSVSHRTDKTVKNPKANVRVFSKSRKPRVVRCGKSIKDSIK